MRERNLTALKPRMKERSRPLVDCCWKCEGWTGSSRCPQVPKRWANWKSTWAYWNWRGCRGARASGCNRPARLPARGSTRVWTLFISWYWSGASSRSWTGNGPGRPGPRRTARASSDFASRGQSLLRAQPRLPRCLLPPRRDAAMPSCSSEQRNCARINIPTNIAHSPWTKSPRRCNPARATLPIRALVSIESFRIDTARNVEDLRSSSRDRSRLDADRFNGSGNLGQVFF